MIILDTNVVAEPMKPDGHRGVHAWLDEQIAETLYLTSISLSELLLGVEAQTFGRAHWRERFSGKGNIVLNDIGLSDFEGPLDEDFRGPNYLAVRSGRSDLLHALGHSDNNNNCHDSSTGRAETKRDELMAVPCYTGVRARVR